MKEIKFPKGEESWNEEQVDALLRIVEDIFHRADIDALINGFTENCVFRFAEQHYANCLKHVCQDKRIID